MMPRIAFGQPTWIDAILDAVEKRIASATGLPRSRVYSYAGDPADLLENAPTERFVTVWFESMEGDQDLLIGSGPAHSGFTSTLVIDVYVRLGTDRDLTDTQLLRDRSFGFAGILRKLLASVQGQTFAEEDNTSIFRAPPRIQSVRLNGRKPRTGWAHATVRLHAEFITDLGGNRC